MLPETDLKNTVEAALLAAAKPLSIDVLLSLYLDEQQPDRSQLRAALVQLQQEYAGRGIEVVEVASGWRIQVCKAYSSRISRLWEEKPGRYSRAMLETLALIAYRQPITRGEIEEIRGVAVSSNIVKTMLERDWVQVVGQRDVPGRPSLYATTREFLDYFGLQGLSDLPTLAEIKDLDELNRKLNLSDPEAEIQQADAANQVVLNMDPGGHLLASDGALDCPEGGAASTTEDADGAVDSDRAEDAGAMSDLNDEIAALDLNDVVAAPSPRSQTELKTESETDETNAENN